MLTKTQQLDINLDFNDLVNERVAEPDYTYITEQNAIDYAKEELIERAEEQEVVNYINNL